MSDTPLTGAPGSSPAERDIHAEQFAGMVMQIANTALVFLGAAPHPETGERVQDLETARLLIGQLEMLEAKTKGNLNPQEAALLKQGLMALRLAFVEASEKLKQPASKPAPSAPPNEAAKASEEPAAASSAIEDERKKFVKKY